MNMIPHKHISKGTLLISSPDIDSGIFFRSIILLCEHTSAGSFGLIINKPLDLELPDEIFNGEQPFNPNISVLAGGPVQTNQMMLLHSSPDIPKQTMKICDGVYLGGDLNFLQESAINETGPKVHLCFGYTGWTSGQLEQEVLEGQWFCLPATEDLVFNKNKTKLWQNSLRLMGGKYATLSLIPDDLSLN